MRRGGNIREDDIGAMEERIRARLAGETPATNTLASQKRSAIEGDEWAKIYRYQVEEGRQIAADALVKRMQARSELVETLARQKAEAAEAKKAEREYEMAYYRMEMADQKAFETECEEKVARRWAAAQKLNDERKVQQEDRDLRRRLQMELKIKEEGDTVSKLAYETRCVAGGGLLLLRCALAVAMARGYVGIATSCGCTSGSTASQHRIPADGAVCNPVQVMSFISLSSHVPAHPVSTCAASPQDGV